MKLFFDYNINQEKGEPFHRFPLRLYNFLIKCSEYVVPIKSLALQYPLQLIGDV